MIWFSQMFTWTIKNWATFFKNFNFWTTLFPKMGPNFWRSLWTSVKVKSKNYFHFTDFFAKIYPLLTHIRKTPPLRSHYNRSSHIVLLLSNLYTVPGVIDPISWSTPSTLAALMVTASKASWTLIPSIPFSSFEPLIVVWIVVTRQIFYPF